VAGGKAGRRRKACTGVLVGYLPVGYLTMSALVLIPYWLDT
jgi:hypothetical protein